MTVLYTVYASDSCGDTQDLFTTIDKEEATSYETAVRKACAPDEYTGILETTLGEKVYTEEALTQEYYRWIVYFPFNEQRANPLGRMNIYAEPNSTILRVGQELRSTMEHFPGMIDRVLRYSKYKNIHMIQNIIPNCEVWADSSEEAIELGWQQYEKIAGDLQKVLDEHKVVEYTVRTREATEATRPS